MSVPEVERAMKGDQDAFAALIDPAFRRMFDLANLILRDRDRAADAVQEAFVHAWRELPRLRDPERFDAWLRRLVVNACYDEARRVRRRAEVALPLAGVRSIDGGGSLLDDRDQVERAFRRLPLEQRTVLVLQHHLAMTHSEIADALGLPLGTVKSRIRYATSAMRAALDAEERGATRERTA